MAAFVYVIGTTGRSGPRTYVGWTIDLGKRLRAHNEGHGAKSTKGYNWILIYAEKHIDKSSAMAREYELKRDRKFRKRLREHL